MSEQSQDLAGLQERIEFLEEKLVELSGAYHAFREDAQRQIDQLGGLLTHHLQVTIQQPAGGQGLDVRA